MGRKNTLNPKHRRSPARRALSLGSPRAIRHTPFRIVHLSDLHLTPGDADARHEPKLANRLIGMNQAFRRIAATRPIQKADLILITGDVTDQGDLLAWQHFREIVRDARLTAKTLAVLGNHDVCALMPRLGRPRRLKRSDLVRAHRGLLLCEQPAKYPWARRVREDIVVFGLDSNNSGNLSPVTNAVGRLGFRQLAAFAGLLHKHREASVKIVMLHHSPSIARQPAPWRRGRPPVSLVTRWLHQLPEEDRHALRLLCLTHRVRLILHGHLHEAEDRLVNGLRIVGAPAATEPMRNAAGSRRFQFFEYTVASASGRVTRSLRTIEVPLEPASHTPDTSR